MKLFYIPGACSVVPHAALREAELPFELTKVSFANPQTLEETSMRGPDGKPQPYVAVFGDRRLFRDINPKGFVPALQTDDGEVITEGAAIHQYIADLRPDAAVMPRLGHPERYQCLELLDQLGRRIHKGVHNVMHTPVSPPARAAWFEGVTGQLAGFAARLNGRSHLLSAFSVADVYLLTNWSVIRAISGMMGRPLGFERWPWMRDYLEAVRTRPSVRAAIVAEGQEARYLQPYE